MRVIGEVQVGGETYRAIWARLSWIDREAHPGSAALALVVRDSGDRNQTIIRRNAKQPDVEASLQHLRTLGFGDADLSQLFAHKGKGVTQHVKVLVSRLT